MTLTERRGAVAEPGAGPEWAFGLRRGVASEDPVLRAVVAHARTVPSAQREAFASALNDLDETSGHVVVHTCHRVEVYAVPGALAGRLPPPPQGARVLDDAEAARHLIAVACGLDSAVFGETQILHQLRETIAERQGARALDPVLDRLFQAALRAGRTAHGWYTGAPRSLADVALDRIAERSGALAGRPVLVVGVGRMGRLAAFAAGRRGARVLVANRTAERAVELARDVGGEAVPFVDLFPASLTLEERSATQLAGAVVAIAAAWPIGPELVAALGDARLPVVDLSSPPATPAGLQASLGDAFTSVDDLAQGDGAGPGGRLRGRLERLISETGRDYCRWIRNREAVPAIQAVVAQAEAQRQAELAWLGRRLPGLSGEELVAIEQMSHRLVAGILHAPLAALNGDDSGDLERAARELFGI